MLGAGLTLGWMVWFQCRKQYFSGLSTAQALTATQVAAASGALDMDNN